MSRQALFIFLLFLFGSFQITAQNIRINEFLGVNNTFPDEEGDYSPAIEIINNSSAVLSLSDFYLSADSLFTQKLFLPNKILSPGEIFLIWLSGKNKENHSNFTLPDPNATLLLVSSNDEILDYIQPFHYNPNESICLSTDFENERYFATRTDLVSLGVKNPSPGPWRRIQTKAKFRPGDSASMGSLVHDGKLWILDYEEVNSSFEWSGVTEVWNSTDGINWTLINASPPYSHPSLFVTFDGYLWAFDKNAYRSKDGITWEKVSQNAPYWGRMTTFKNKLWVVQGSYIYSSIDGITWNIETGVPWIYRPNPGLIEFNGMLYAFGGLSNYGTIYEFYWQDVWRSSDGINWELVLYKAPWRGTVWFTYATFDNKLWMLGGSSSFINSKGGNINDIWYTEDGINWNLLDVENVWSPRHANFIWVKNNEMIIAAGYEGGGPSGTFNDVWKFSKLSRDLTVSIGDNSTELNPVMSNENVTKTYGDAPTYLNIQSELETNIQIADQEVIRYQDGGLKIENAGTSKVTISQISNVIFQGDSIVLNVEVNKQTLDIYPGNYTRSFGDTNPNFSLTFSGFQYSDDEDVIDVPPSITTEADMFSPTGEYEINLIGGADNNYNLHFNTGTLQIVGDSNSEKVWVFPNPAQEQTSLLFEDEQTSAKFQLIDSKGEVLQEIYGISSNQYTVDLKGLQQGIYLLRILDTRGTNFVKKLVLN